MTFTNCIGVDHIWRQLRASSITKSQQPILFLDRDGVVVEEVNYLFRVQDVRFIEGVIETIITARRYGWWIVLVTNQAGIGRGYFDWRNFSEVNDFMLRYLDSQGAIFDAVIATPHHHEGIGVYQHLDHPMRKPNPGMLFEAAEMLNGNLSQSLIVGDNATDILAGKRAGLSVGFLVKTGHGLKYLEESKQLTSINFFVNEISNIGDYELRRALMINK